MFPTLFCDKLYYFSPFLKIIINDILFISDFNNNASDMGKNNTSETQVKKTRYPKMSDYGNKFKVSEFKI